MTGPTVVANRRDTQLIPDTAVPGPTQQQQQQQQQQHKKRVSRAPPVIDLSTSEDALVAAVQRACREWGFFQIINHGVDSALRRDFEEAQRSLFRLERHVKKKYERSANNARGFVETEMTKGKVDHKECFDIGNMVDWDAPQDAAVNQGLNGTNRFPSDADLPGFRNVVRRYFKEMDRVATLVAELMALGMGTRRTYFRDTMASEHTSHLRLNFYPPCDDPGAALGVGPHTDAGFLTVLAQDMKVCTLQVKDRATGSWMPVTPVEGAFTINTGDLAVIFSNNEYHAPEHRVLASAKERFSAPYFYNPSYEATIAPVPTLVSETNPSQFWPMTWGYFRAQRVMNNFGVGEYVKAQMWQVQHERDGEKPRHVRLQEKFQVGADYRVPFDIIEYQRQLALSED